MLCDKCHKREAKIYYTEIVNGVKKEQYLCEECAAEATTFYVDENGKKESTIGGLLSTILGNYYSENSNASEGEEVRCDKCGMPYNEFLRYGVFGCGTCYKSFAPYLEKCFKNIQGADVHVGKKPKNMEESTDSVIKGLSELEVLSIKLQDAVEKEEFEQAAKYRDQIRTLKKKDEKSEVNNA